MTSKNAAVTKYVGPAPLTLLGLLFIALKLTGHIAWSWWWVLAPFWLGWAVVVALIVLLAVLS